MNKELIGLCAIILLLFVSCSNGIQGGNSENQGGTSGNQTGSSTEEEKTYVYVSVDDDDFENMEALQLTKVMGNGINLGNTMDACGGGWIGFKKDPLEYEHCWGMPETQKEMFTAYKEAGFDCVRIPVSWLSAMDIAKITQSIPVILIV